MRSSAEISKPQNISFLLKNSLTFYKWLFLHGIFRKTSADSAESWKYLNYEIQNDDPQYPDFGTRSSKTESFGVKK